MNEYEMIKEVIQKYCKPNPTIFEIGCYDGKLTNGYYNYSQTKPLHYFAFEADPANFKKMLKNNNIPPEVILVNKAIAEYTGVIKFHQSHGELNGNQYDVSGSIRPPKEHLTIFPHVKFESEIEIKCVSLDFFCEKYNINEIDIILADIQGAEKNMIEGGREIIKKTKFMFLEKCDDELYEGQLTTEPMKEFLSDIFNVYKEFENDILFYNKNVKL